MDTDEGWRVSQQIINHAWEIEAREQSKHEPIYEDPATPSFTTSTAAMADILSERSHYPPQDRLDPSPSKVGMDLMKESFEPFDFTQEFREQHGIAPEQAPTPWNSNSRQTECRVPLEYSQIQGPLRPGSRNSTSSDRMEEIKTPGVAQGELVRQRDAWEMV